MRNSVWSQWIKRRNALNAKKQKNRYEKNRWDKGGSGSESSDSGPSIGSDIQDITTTPSDAGETTSYASDTHSHMGMPWISVDTITDLPELPDNVVTSRTITDGTETNAYTDTETIDSVFHLLSPDTGETDFYYEFDLGSTSITADEAEWKGYAQGNGHTYSVGAYNWDTTSWDTVTSITGTTATDSQTVNINLTAAHTSSGGIVQIAFASSDGTAFATDRIRIRQAENTPGCFAYVTEDNQAYQNVNEQWVKLVHFFNESAEPTTGITGDFWIDSDDDTLWYYTGTEWVQILTTEVEPLVYETAGILYQKSTDIPISHFA